MKNKLRESKMAKKEKKEETKTKSKKTSKEPKFSLKELFENDDFSEQQIKEVLLLNGINDSIENIDIKLTKAEFKEVIDDYSNKRLL